MGTLPTIYKASNDCRLTTAEFFFPTDSPTKKLLLSFTTTVVLPFLPTTFSFTTEPQYKAEDRTFLRKKQWKCYREMDYWEMHSHLLASFQDLVKPLITIKK